MPAIDELLKNQPASTNRLQSNSNWMIPIMPFALVDQQLRKRPRPLSDLGTLSKEKKLAPEPELASGNQFLSWCLTLIFSIRQA
jgi:hypothetical protein